jgi:hypothetical protein
MNLDSSHYVLNWTNPEYDSYYGKHMWNVFHAFHFTKNIRVFLTTNNN